MIWPPFISHTPPSLDIRGANTGRMAIAKAAISAAPASRITGLPLSCAHGSPHKLEVLRSPDVALSAAYARRATAREALDDIL